MMIHRSKIKISRVLILILKENIDMYLKAGIIIKIKIIYHSLKDNNERMIITIHNLNIKNPVNLKN